jgi:hypothetical protein
MCLHGIVIAKSTECAPWCRSLEVFWAQGWPAKANTLSPLARASPAHARGGVCLRPLRLRGPAGLLPSRLGFCHRGGTRRVPVPVRGQRLSGGWRVPGVPAGGQLSHGAWYGRVGVVDSLRGGAWIPAHRLPLRLQLVPAYAQNEHFAHRHRASYPRTRAGWGPAA